MANGVIIGGATFSNYRTWASLRTVFSQNNFTLEHYSVEYPIMQPGIPSFRSLADGSGLIRADAFLVRAFGTQNFEIEGTNVIVNPSPPPPFLADMYLWLDWYDYAAASTLVPIEVQTQLIGQSVTLSAASPITITSSLFTTTGGRQFYLYATGIPQGYVVAVGKLTPIT